MASTIRVMDLATDQRVPTRVLVSNRTADLETGETLGMTGDGYGGELTEYLTLAVTYVRLADAIDAFQECENKPTMDTKLCCLMEANINNVAGLSFGSILGKTTSSAGAAVFYLVDRESGGALMPSANAWCDQLPATEW